MSDTSSPRPVIRILQEFSIPQIAGVVIAVLWADIDEHSLHGGEPELELQPAEATA